MAQSLVGYSGENMTESGGLREPSMDPEITDVIMLKGVGHAGVNERIRGNTGKSGIMKVVAGVGEIIVVKTEENNNVIQNEGLTFIDAKRRRTQKDKEMDQTNKVMGQTLTIKTVNRLTQKSKNVNPTNSKEEGDRFIMKIKMGQQIKKNNLGKRDGKMEIKGN